MIVDDSAVIRGLTTRILEADKEIQIVASVGNGKLAVSNLDRYDVDVVVLDIEMPVMDGLTALPLLLEIDPSVKIVISSTLSLRNANISIQALEAGASDYLPKPTSTVDIHAEGGFRRELVEKVKALGIARRSKIRPSPSPERKAGVAAAPAIVKPAAKDFTLRKPGLLPPKILAVGSSTGGPQALLEFFKGLSPSINLPVVLTQHMPPTFTTIMAQHITKMTEWDCREGVDGEELRSGVIYLAPGDNHMQVVKKGDSLVIELNQGPQENFCRPAVDPMLRSIVNIFGGKIITVILTGMGADGHKGCVEVVNSGGTVIAQDETTSVVWGMPGAVAMDNICSAVLPLGELASHVENFISKGR
ncbi:MAG TPA: chemotaxis response regulator protein-glutamate methylesterase [Rhodospirillales bacterium]|nr:chemotaxis response regulator protein-glutamate methylesterase [Rhodospirillales bacterium]